MSKRPEVILVHETVLQSWVRDASTVFGFVTLIGTGVYLDSSALQWVGAILGFVATLGRAMSLENVHRVTVAEARKRLDAIEARFWQETCDGFDDPEERCPRHPSECSCWRIRRAVESEAGE